MIETFEPLQKLIKNQFDAAMSLGATLAKGAGKIAAEAQDYSKSSLEANAALLHKLAAAKTADEVLKLQAAHVKSICDLSLARSKKIGELVTDISKDALDTLTSDEQSAVKAVKAPNVGHIAQAAE